MPEFDSEVNRIVGDKTHGSSSLLSEISRVLREFNPSPQQLKWAFQQFKKMDSSMVLIRHFLKTMSPHTDQKATFARELRGYLETWRKVPDTIAAELMHILPQTTFRILLHSHSGMVIKVIGKLRERNQHVSLIQTQSNPGGEGAEQKKALEHQGFNVELIPDKELPEGIKRVHCCFLGVDQYDQNKFVNKVGSRAIVAEAGRQSKRVYILGDPRKEVVRVPDTSTPPFETVDFQHHTQLITGN